MNDSSTSRLPLIAAVVAGLAIRVYLIFATPVGSPSTPGLLSSYNDELAHVNYIDYVQRTGSLPSNVESIKGERALTEGYYEYYQPPLYYDIVATVGRITDIHEKAGLTLLGRVLNVVLFATLFPLLNAIGSLLKISRSHTDAALIFLALNGVLVRFSTTASNDILFWLFAGGMIWYALRIWKQDSLGLNLLLFTGFAIVALYTKLTALIFLPLPALMLFRGWRARRVLGLMCSYALVALLTFPVWLRNAGEFGSLLPLSAGFGSPDYSIPAADSVLYAIRSFVFPWTEFWRGWIGLLLMIPVFVSVAVSIIRRATWQLFAKQPLMSAAMVLTLLAFVWLNVQYRQAEARYLFAAWPVLAIASTGAARNTVFQWLLVASLLLPFGLFCFPAIGI